MYVGFRVAGKRGRESDEAYLGNNEFIDKLDVSFARTAKISYPWSLCISTKAGRYCIVSR